MGIYVKEINTYIALQNDQVKKSEKNVKKKKKLVDKAVGYMYNNSCAGQIAHRKLERYRSGHNEAVLKTVCPQGRVGSNPTLSVID